MSIADITQEEDSTDDEFCSEDDKLKDFLILLKLFTSERS